jgi:hypothetical protein
MSRRHALVLVRTVGIALPFPRLDRLQYVRRLFAFRRAGDARSPTTCRLARSATILYSHPHPTDPTRLKPSLSPRPARSTLSHTPLKSNPPPQITHITPPPWSDLGRSQCCTPMLPVGFILFQYVRHQSTRHALVLDHADELS